MIATNIARHDYARSPVPLSERRSWIPITLIWMGVGIDLSGVALGSALAQGMSLGNVIIAVVIGSFILGILAALCSVIGARTGLSMGMIVRFTFGEWGNRLVLLAMLIVGFGWFGVQTGLFGYAANAAISGAIGVEISAQWLTIVGGLLMTLTATLGYIAIERLSVVAIPFVITLLGYLLFHVFSHSEIRQTMWEAPAGGGLGLGMGISLVISGWVMGTFLADVARWARSTRDAALSGFFGFFIGNMIMLLLATSLVHLMGTDDVIIVMISTGMGTFVVLFLLLAQWTTNDNALYSLGLVMASMVRSIPKPVLCIVAGLAGTTLGFLGIADNFTTFLTYITPFTAPIGGIYLVEYFLINPSRFHFAFAKTPKIPALVWHTMLVWAAGAFVAFATTPDLLGWFALTHVPALDAGLVAAALHLMIGKFLGRLRKKEDSSSQEESAST
ncbi:cytosine permease [Desmospora profundinema]|uniref:Cytosine permease n=1 Tax=Desmospora profundinema TaxID=1571184 RepID=A0ABU1IN98_9BACL|nr:cytosine permease [Desmospora profundinema]MDR6226176.1 cytosine permease [Desmospora profundinema]